MSKKFIAGNWKLNPDTGEQAIELCWQLKIALAPFVKVKIAVCPPSIVLPMIAEFFKGTNVAVGAQDIYWEDAGAFTGEISGPMIKSAGCSHVIIGHSERRQYFGETNQTVHKKINAALRHNLLPIVCVGETLEQRESSVMKDIVREQIVEALSGMQDILLGNLVIAYEPVWAIGTGKTATPEQAQEMHRFIRELLTENFSESLSETTPILYGGSVKADNAAELFSQPDIDGALVGGASLKADSFAAIVKSGEELS